MTGRKRNKYKIIRNKDRIEKLIKRDMKQTHTEIEESSKRISERKDGNALVNIHIWESSKENLKQLQLKIYVNSRKYEYVWNLKDLS